MNLRPPPTTNNLVAIRAWQDELYRFLQKPVFPGGITVGGTSNYGSFANDGELTFGGTGRVLNKRGFVLDGIGKGATAPTLVRLSNTYGYSFTINDDGYMSLSLPNIWALGTSVQVKLHYYINEAYATANGEIRFTGTWGAYPHNSTEVVGAATHTGTLDSGDVNIPATAKLFSMINMGTIAGASLSADDCIFILLKRVALVGGNNPTAEPVIIHVQYVLTGDKLGDAT